jgi:hypothetical protein
MPVYKGRYMYVYKGVCYFKLYCEYRDSETLGYISSIHPFSLFLKRLKDGRGGRMKRKGGMMKGGEGNGGRIKERKVNGKRIKGRKGK